MIEETTCAAVAAKALAGDKLEVRRGPEATPDPALSLGNAILHWLREHQTRTALIDAHLGTSMSFHELLVLTTYAAEGYKAMGLVPGDVVAVVSRNYHEQVAALLGAVCAGLRVAYVDPTGDLAEMRHSLELVRPKAVVSERDRLRAAMEAYPDARHVVLSGEPPEPAVETFLGVLRLGEDAEPRPDPRTYRAVDVADPGPQASLILYSSGSTGLPKAVLVPDSLGVHSSGETEATEAGSGRYLACIPPSGIGPWKALLSGLKSGAARVFTTLSDSPTILSAIERFKVRGMGAVPAVFRELLIHKEKCKHRYDLSSLEELHIFGSVCDAELHAALERHLHGRVLQKYGCAETARVLWWSASKPSPPGALGTLGAGVEIRLVDVDTGEDVPAAVKHAVGELRVRSKTVMLGYLGNPVETARAFDEHGFYKTGDLVYEDADGHYFFVERSVEMLTYKGAKVSPSEVEAVLLQHPGVREACVLGRRVGEGEAPDDLPAAFVSRADDAAGEAVTAGALRAAVAERLSDAHRLRGGVYFLDSLPRAGLSRKVARSKLKEMLLHWETGTEMERAGK